jgi:hypothetical protein
MPGLTRELVEHQLLIKADFRPYKQGAQNFKPEIVRRVKEEVDRLLPTGFIQSCRYADWVSNSPGGEEEHRENTNMCGL